MQLTVKWLIGVRGGTDEHWSETPLFKPPSTTASLGTRRINRMIPFSS
jgi:hypothetical protein